MKKNKILSLLLAPVLATGILAGCGESDKIADAYTTYKNMQASYATLGQVVQTTSENPYEYPRYVSAESDLYYVKNVDGQYELTYLVDATYDVTLLSNVNVAHIRAKEDITELTKGDNVYDGYYGVLKVQDTVVKAVYNYYNNHAANFYKIMEGVKVEKADAKELNKRADALQRATATFHAAKDVFETSVTTAGGVNVHGFIFNGYAKSYNDFIETSLNFVEYFKDLHIKYVIKEDAYKNGDDTERVKDEMILNVAKVLYMEDLKAFNYSDCDLSDLTHDLVMNTTVQNNYAKLLQELLNLETSTNPSSAGKVFELLNAHTTMLSTEESVVFKAIVEAFNKKVALYENVYGQVKMYEYNRARSGYGTVDKETFMNSQTAEMQSKYNFIDDFYNYTFSQYANYILSLVK
ncbi:MAG: hypothetical protein IK070_00980 [Clostridia bacterium]|nr:hypothetical protein [Clostridia bacterium]